MADVQLSEEAIEFEKQFEDLFNTQTKVREIISECRVVIREEAEAGFLEDGEKKRLGGIGIRVGTVLNYDNKLAFNWAKEHSLALNLDRRRFEQLAKTEEIEFVTKEEKITVTFPKVIKIENNEVKQNE